MIEKIETKSRVKAVRESLIYRRSVRTFNSQPIPKEILDNLIEVAKHAPSGSNWQNQRFLVITDPSEIQKVGKIRFVWPYKAAKIDKIKQSHPAGILGHGAALILVFADASRNDARGNGEYYIWESLETQNCAASVQNILTLATAYGLGSCWVSASEKMNYNRMLSGQSWRAALSSYDIPDFYKIQGVVVLGYPRKYDDEGYAVGEKMHGATNWASTDRKDNDHYLIKKLAESNESKLTSIERLLVQVLSKGIKGLLGLIRLFDKGIHRIEFERFIRKN